MSVKWRRVSLRSLLILMLLFSIAFAWFAARMRYAQRQREAVVALGEESCMLQYDPYGYEIFGLREGNHYKEIPNSKVPHWLLDLLGDDFFSSVDYIDFSGPMEVRSGPVSGSLEQRTITDQHVKHLANLSYVRSLNLSSSDIDDDDLDALLRLKKVEILDLDATEITDGGIATLVELPSLRVLHVSRNDLTDEGILRLREKVSLRELQCYGMTFSDETLSELAAFPQLEVLRTSSTRFTDEGVAKVVDYLERERPDVSFDIERLSNAPP